VKSVLSPYREHPSAVAENLDPDGLPGVSAVFQVVRVSLRRPPVDVEAVLLVAEAHFALGDGELIHAYHLPARLVDEHPWVGLGDPDDLGCIRLGVPAATREPQAAGRRGERSRGGGDQSEPHSTAGGAGSPLVTSESSSSTGVDMISSMSSLSAPEIGSLATASSRATAARATSS
jgi:hypothetical protein